MTAENEILAHEVSHDVTPHVRDIRIEDVMEALSKGVADFKACPTHIVFLFVIYPIAMLAIARAFGGFEFLPLIFPMIAGSTILGPFAALGMYELSRRREQGLPVSWLNLFDVLKSPALFSIIALGVVLGVVFLAWLVAAQALYWSFIGSEIPASVFEFLIQSLTSPSSIALIVVGGIVGALFATVGLVIGVVSFPMLLDRNVGISVAVSTSVRAVTTNPMTLFAWGIIVALLLIAGAVPLLLGLAFVMPILGHATWHLYRKMIAY